MGQHEHHQDRSVDVMIHRYPITWKGRPAHVDAEVEQVKGGSVVRVYSIDFDDHDREQKTYSAETVYKDDFDSSGKPNMRAFAAWIPQDRQALYTLVREADARGAQR